MSARRRSAWRLRVGGMWGDGWRVGAGVLLASMEEGWVLRGLGVETAFDG